MDKIERFAIVIILNVLFIVMSSQFVQAQEIYNLLKARNYEMAQCINKRFSSDKMTVEKVTISDATEKDSDLTVKGEIHRKMKEGVSLTGRILKGLSGWDYYGTIKYEVKFNKVLDAVTLREIKAYKMNYETDKWEISVMDFPECLD